MLVPTPEVLQFLGSKGFVRDNSEPFSCYVGYKRDKEILVIDESYYLIDIDFLIEDAETLEAPRIAAELKEWRII